MRFPEENVVSDPAKKDQHESPGRLAVHPVEEGRAASRVVFQMAATLELRNGLAERKLAIIGRKPQNLGKISVISVEAGELPGLHDDLRNGVAIMGPGLDPVHHHLGDGYLSPDVLPSRFNTNQVSKKLNLRQASEVTVHRFPWLHVTRAGRLGLGIARSHGEVLRVGIGHSGHALVSLKAEEHPEGDSLPVKLSSTLFHSPSQRAVSTDVAEAKL